MTITRRQIIQILRRETGTAKNKTLMARIDKARADGMGWAFDGLEDWTTEAIFDKLHELGIDTSPEQFRVQAEAASRCAALEGRWRENLEPHNNRWDDFPFIAAEVLWKRLAADLRCPEMVASEIETILEGLEQDNKQAGLRSDERVLEAILVVLDYLETVPDIQRAEAFSELQACMLLDINSWLLDRVLELGRTHPDEIIRLADVMSTFCDAENYQGDLAMALAEAGHREEALKRISANLARWPHDTWIRIKAGDVHRELGDSQLAAQCYITALGMAEDSFDWDAVAVRLEDLPDDLEGKDRLQELRQRYPRPEPRLSEAFSIPPREEPAPTPTRSPIGVLTSGDYPQLMPLPETKPTRIERDGPKVGRNDPCPCGSGKKHKKCCLRKQ